MMRLKPFLHILIVFLVFFIFNPLSLAQVSTQATKDQLQRERQELQRNISQKKKEAQQKKEEAEKLKQIINRLNSDIAATQKKVSDTKANIDQTKKEIEKLIFEIKKREEELGVEKGKQDEVLREIYEVQNSSELFLVIGSRSLSEVIEHNQYLEALETRIEATIADIEKLKKELLDKKTSQEQKQRELEDLEKRLSSYQGVLETQRKEKDRVLIDTRTAVKSLESQIEEAKQRQGEVDKALAALFSKQRGGVKARDKGTSAVGFSWPMDYIYISQDFDDPWVFNPAVSHGGLDLVNAEGTPIYAAANGTVEVGSFYDNGHFYGYGNYIIIYHNARFATLYGHLSSFAVESNAEVKGGDLIGYVGSTGWSTGPHLHFEVREDGSRVNPLAYLP
ncbi:peptidoglycan DD-metalloendopeptidase family protein [Candidatus Berkelbacteria bacterium]|nr:peptidoglycan DD-metalloendopeptidase family protein [Candidatus Berkelbacteria bacterium]